MTLDDALLLLDALADAWEQSGEKSRGRGLNPRDPMPASTAEAAATARIGCAQALRGVVGQVREATPTAT